MKLAIIIAVLAFTLSYAQATDINIKLVRLEEKVEGLNKRFDDINRRIDDTNKQIYILRDDMKILREDMNRRFEDISTLIYIVLGGIITLIGVICSLIVFIIWDRKTLMKPVIDEVNTIKQDLQDKVNFMWNHFGLDRKQKIATA